MKNDTIKLITKLIRGNLEISKIKSSCKTDICDWALNRLPKMNTVQSIYEQNPIILDIGVICIEDNLKYKSIKEATAYYGLAVVPQNIRYDGKYINIGNLHFAALPNN